MTFSFIFSLVVLSVLGSFLLFHAINPMRWVSTLYAYVILRVSEKNIKKSVKNIKNSQIVKDKKNVWTGYRKMARGLILDYNLPISVEGFNSFILFLFIVTAIGVFLFVKSIVLSMLITASLLVAAFTYLLMQARISESNKMEYVMDALDLICPIAKEGVLVAIKKVLENPDTIHRNIRPYFIQFVDNAESLGYTFKQALEVLNRQLGPKFDNFAKKALVFEMNERKGMADIFLDIVDENAALREVNTRKNMMFRKMNREFYIKTLMISLFFGYSMLGSGYRAFMIHSNIGRMVIGFTVIVVCLSYARCQILQRDIT